MLQHYDSWKIAVTLVGTAAWLGAGCGGHESKRRFAGSTTAAATSAAPTWDAPAFIPSDVAPTATDDVAMPTSATAPTAPRHWYQGNTLGNPLKVHSAEEECLAQAVLNELNCQRKKAGLRQLACDPEAARPAKAHAEDMAGRLYFGATTPEGLKLEDRLRLLEVKGFTAAAENLATGFRTKAAKGARDVVAGWMESAAMKETLLAPGFTHVGIGVALTPSPHASAVFLTREGQASSAAPGKKSCAKR